MVDPEVELQPDFPLHAQLVAVLAAELVPELEPALLLFAPVNSGYVLLEQLLVVALNSQDD